MFFFILQTLFLAFVAFLLGWLLGRLIKGFFCKPTDAIEPRSALKTELDSSKEDHSASDASSVTKSAVISTAAATASAAIIAKMASDVKNDSSVGNVSDVRNTIVEERTIVGKTDDVSGGVKATIEKNSVVDAVKNSNEKTKEVIKNSVVIDKADDSVIGDTVEIKNAISNKAINVQANDTSDVIKDESERLKGTGFDEISNVMSGTAGVLSEKDININKGSSKVVDTQNNDSSTLFDSAKAVGVGIAAKTGIEAIKGGDDTVKEIGNKTGEAFKEQHHLVGSIDDKVNGVSVDLKDSVRKNNIEKNDLVRDVVDKADDSVIGDTIEIKNAISNKAINVQANDTSDVIKDDNSTLFDSAKALAVAAGVGIAAKTGIEAIKGGDDTVKEIGNKTGEAFKEQHDLVGSIDDKVNGVSVDLKDSVGKNNIEKNNLVRDVVDKADDSVIGDIIEIKNAISNKAINVQANDTSDVIKDENERLKGSSKVVDTQNNDSSTLFDSAKALAVAAGVGIAAKTAIEAIKGGGDTVKEFDNKTGEAFKEQHHLIGSIDDKVDGVSNGLKTVVEKSNIVDQVKEKIVGVADIGDTITLKSDVIDNIKDKADDSVIGDTVEIKNAISNKTINVQANDTSDVIKDENEGHSKAVNTQTDDSFTLFDSAKALAVAAGIGIAVKTGVEAIKGDDTVKEIGNETGEAIKNSVEKTADIDDSSGEKKIHSVIINDDLVVTSEVILEEKQTKTPNDLGLSKGEALKEERHFVGNIDDKADGVSNGLKEIVEKNNIVAQIKEKIDGIADIDNTVRNTQGEAHHSTLFDIAKTTVVATGVEIVAKADSIKSGDDTAEKMIEETREIIKNKSEKTLDILESIAGNIEVKTKAIDAVVEDGDSIDKIEKTLDGVSSRVSGTSDAALSLQETKVVDTHDDRATVLDIAKASALAAVAGIVAKKLSSEGFDDDKVNSIAEDDNDREITTLYRHCNLHRFRSSSRSIHRVNLPRRNIRRFSSSRSHNCRLRAIRR